MEKYWEVGGFVLSDMNVRIRQLRKDKKMTQEQLADRLDITRATVNSYERGLAYPSADIQYKMCIVLDTTSDYLMGLDNKRRITVEGLPSRYVSMLCELRDIFNILVQRGQE